MDVMYARLINVHISFSQSGLEDAMSCNAGSCRPLAVPYDPPSRLCNTSYNQSCAGFLFVVSQYWLVRHGLPSRIPEFFQCTYLE